MGYREIRVKVRVIKKSLNVSFSSDCFLGFLCLFVLTSGLGSSLLVPLSSSWWQGPGSVLPLIRFVGILLSLSLTAVRLPALAVGMP